MVEILCIVNMCVETFIIFVMKVSNNFAVHSSGFEVWLLDVCMYGSSLGSNDIFKSS